MKEKTKELKNKLEQLAGEVVVNGDEMDRYIKSWRNGFHSYSFGNMLLIYFQKGNATLCAGYKTWQKKGRHVKKGQKGISVLAPVFKKINEEVENEKREKEKVEKVITLFREVKIFDISQTEGKDLENEVSNYVNGRKSKITFEGVKDVFSFKVEIIKNVTKGGSTNGEIVKITKSKNEAFMLSSLFHELGHCYLNHVGDKEKTREIKEIEAEAVSYMVSSYFDIQDEGSKFYIKNWGGDKETVKKSGLKILQTAEKIIRKIEEKSGGDDPPQKRK